MIKLIIFDLDGTLVNTLKDITIAVTHALNFKQGYGLSTFEVSKMIGEGADVLIEKAIKKYPDAPKGRFDQSVCLNRYLEYYEEHMYDFTKLYPGVFRAIGPLLKYHKMAVISNKSVDFTRRILRHFYLWLPMEIVVGGDSLPEKKPSPMPCLYILKKLHIKPEEAILVGDTETDIKCGKATGVKTVAATYGYGKPGFQWEADYVIGDITELPKIVKEIK